MATHIKKYYLTYISFTLPAIVLMAYYATRQMTPFGNSTTMTVDLGQQLVDFYSGIRHTLLSSPNSIFYTFTKNFGAEIYSEWTTYMFSPLNLFLLLFNQANLPIGLFFLAVIKVGLAGLTFYYSINKIGYVQNKYLVLIASFAYSLSGWLVANQVNLHWQDNMVLLPLLAFLTVQTLRNKKDYVFFVVVFLMAIVNNYYTGYMVGIFLPLFALWVVTKEKIQLSNYLWYLLKMVISVLGAAFVLVPTAYQLLLGKGREAILAPEISFVNNFWAAPFKLIPGSFNFEQMKTGFANIFIPIILVFGVILYFQRKNQNKWSKIVASAILVFYGLSITFKPLILFQHMMQYPVWYPYRFSFIPIFFLLLLALIGLQDLPRISVTNVIIFFVLTFTIGLTAFGFLSRFDFLSSSSINLFVFMGILSIIALLTTGIYRTIGIGFIVFVLTTSNLIIATDNFAYINNNEYKKTVQAINDGTSLIQDKGFYRVGQTFMRTKGDGFAANFFGSGHFASTQDARTPLLYQSFGQGSTSYNEIYDLGTKATDNIFGYKYFLAPSNSDDLSAGSPQSMLMSVRPDYQGDNQTYTSKSDVRLYTNHEAFPIAYMVPSTANEIKINKQEPIQNTENFLQGVTGYADGFFTSIPLTNVEYTNIENEVGTNLSGATLKKKDTRQAASIKITFVPQTNNSYYLTLGPWINDESAQLIINGTPLRKIENRRGTGAYNIAFDSEDEEATLQINLKKDSLYMSKTALYMLDNSTLSEQSQIIQQRGVKNLKFSNTKITGDVTSNGQNPILMTSIPYVDGWTLKIDGKPADITVLSDYFIGATVPKGTHKIELTYKEPYLNIGVIISIITIFSIFGVEWSFRQWSKNPMKI